MVTIHGVYLLTTGVVFFKHFLFMKKATLMQHKQDTTKTNFSHHEIKTQELESLDTLPLKQPR